MKVLNRVVSFVIVLLVGLFIGYLLWGPTWEVPQEFKYDVIKDTLVIVLAVVGVFIAVVGVAVYGLVTQRLTTEVEKRITDESKRWITRLATSTGYSLWRSELRGEAIRLTKEAHDKYISGLDENETENMELIGSIRNNLAWYLACTKQEGEKSIARGCALYIHSISHRFPEHRDDWEKTYRKVLEVFPD